MIVGIQVVSVVAYFSSELDDGQFGMGGTSSWQGLEEYRREQQRDCTLKNSKLMEDLVVHPIPQTILCGPLEGAHCFGVE